MVKKQWGVLFLLLLAAPAILGAVDSVSVLNRTGYDIYYLYISPGTADSWGDDVLGDDVLLDGDVVSIPLNKFSDICSFDVKAVDQDDDSYIKWEFDACSRGKIIFTLDDLYDEEGGGDGIQDFTILNETGFSIYHIYVSPDYADDWEEDLLGDTEVLMDGETFDVSFSGYGDHCTFDVRLVDNEGDTYTSWGVDLCSTYTLSISLDDLDYWGEFHLSANRRGR